jgi:hypothetical protein
MNDQTQYTRQLTDKEKALADAGKRASDLANLYITFMPWEELRTKWMAIRLIDGSSDAVLYDSKRDAVKHQIDERLCAYFAFRNCGGGTNPRDMAVFLTFARDAYDAGFRLPDPDAADGGPDVLMTAAQRDYYRGSMGI